MRQKSNATTRLFGESLRTELKKGKGIKFLKKLGKHQDWIHQFIPELLDCINIEGGHHHGETIFEHLLQSLGAAYKQSVRVQMAALLHDIGKPSTYKKDKEGNISFHGHEVKSAVLARRICLRLGFSKWETDKISKLVRYHMFRFPENVQERTLRRWLFKVGPDWEDLFLLREADRKGNNLNKYKPAETLQMKKLKKKLYKIIKESNVIFREDLNISEKIVKKTTKKKDRLHEIFPTLVGLVNEDPSRNNPSWLGEYIGRVFG